MNVIELLKNDHQKVRELLKQLNETSEPATKLRVDLLAEIEKELLLHTQLEEEIFYPAFREGGQSAGHKEDEQLYFEAREEHRAVEKLVLPDLLKTDPMDSAFSGRAKVLKEMVEHHAEEEESSMFPEAQRVLSQEQLEALGVRMTERKKELLALAA